ncbi:MAG: hypothetical protein AAGE01_01095 [Pseudomonadota bacterium]
MFDFRINHARNALYCILEGRFDAEETRRFAERFRAAVDELEPGMVIITDLTGFIPTDEEVRQLAQEATAYAAERGISRAVRIVADSVGSRVGNIQLTRTARASGYQADVVTSMDEARSLLGWR